MIFWQCARTAGPKFGPNLYDIAKELCPADFLESVDGAGDPPAFGWFVDQKVASPELERWRLLRLNIIKRPFLATSEKYLDTCKAQILVASAFHPSFSDKMFELASRGTELEACVILRRGCEGSMVTHEPTNPTSEIPNPKY